MEGYSWEAAGAYDLTATLIARRGKVDGCASMQDVVRRYEDLDRMFDTMAREQRLRTAAEMRSGRIREEGGVYFHVGRDGTPIFGGGGNHRLAAAIALDIPTIPAQLGVVHPEGLDALAVLRCANWDEPSIR